MTDKEKEKYKDCIELMKKSDVLRKEGVTSLRSKNLKHFEGYIPVKCRSPYSKSKFVIRYIDKDKIIDYIMNQTGQTKSK